jgi:CDP-glucose 4,6-dehydratase
LTTTSNIWKDRPVLVTGATGLVGSWLTRRLHAAGADVVCLVRDWIPQSEVVRSGTLDAVKIVRGDICDRDLLERTLGEYHHRDLECARSLPPLTRHQGHRSGVVR